MNAFLLALGSLFNLGIGVWQSWHQSSGVDPTALANEAAQIAGGVAQSVTDGEQAYQEVKKQLLESHPDMPVMQARVLAATAAEHISASNRA